MKYKDSPIYAYYGAKLHFYVMLIFSGDVVQ